MSVPSGGEWARVHPVSPLVRGWIALAAIAFVLGRNVVEDLVGLRGGENDGVQHSVGHHPQPGIDIAADGHD